jgi:hypothetical protein
MDSGQLQKAAPQARRVNVYIGTFIINSQLLCAFTSCKTKEQLRITLPLGLRHI